MASELVLRLITLLLFYQGVFRGTTEATPREEILEKIRELYNHDPQALFQLMHVSPPVIVDPTATTDAPAAKGAEKRT
ncbi:hypothetical protein ANCCAN_19575 [Ancylostoma caninum]|uniref:Uncharacterized protein n=1 Tax=Ancylostoma caninum TaxID=29170 RepID=A0A368FU87_ANCCA|nr:hypothetical protein ANCCAN_19575 [Ancylostoma caninum]